MRVSSDGLPGAPVGLASVARFTEKNSARTLILDTSDVPVPRGEYLELWLIDSNVDKMVSLGAARPDGRYSIPAGINLADYPVVNVSAEPLDGNPKHSGASLLRGIVTV